MKLSRLNLRWLFSLVAAISLSAAATSCGSDDGDEPNAPSEPEMNAKQKSVYDQLVNTTWALEKSVDYRDGVYYENNLDWKPEYSGGTITFSSEINPCYTSFLKLYCSSFPNSYFSWYPSKETNADVGFFISNAPNSAADGSFFSVFGVGDMKMTITGDRLYLKREEVSDLGGLSYTYITEYTYRRSSSGGGNTGGGSSSSDNYEEPDVYFYDYTEYGSSSVKVDFLIANKDDCGFTSAQIKYGKTSSASSSVSSNVSGKHVIATITGLKANTDYYVKCTVKSKGGTVTTPATRIRLSSW